MDDRPALTSDQNRTVGETSRAAARDCLAEARAAMGEALRFRHRLVPYLHTMNHRAAADTVRRRNGLEQGRP